MRIHSDTLTYSQIIEAASKAGVEVELTSHGSRSRKQAHNVNLYGSGRTGGRWGNTGTSGAAPLKSATWDEWGIFLEALFSADSRVFVKGTYETHEQFRWITASRYDTLAPGDQHIAHRWNAPGTGSVAGGSYYVRACKCGAVVRNPAYGHDLSEIVEG